MEEVDGIIVHNLRAVGCDLEDDVDSLRHFTPEMVVEAAARCLHAIDPSTELHYKLPPSMAARFRVGTSLATAVQALGFKGDIGYHTFLYSNELEVRRVLMFLVDRLPKEHSESTQEPLSSMALLQRTISTEMSKHLSRPWILPLLRPHVLSGSGVRRFRSCRLATPSGLHNIAHPPSKESSRYYRSSALSFVDTQPIRRTDLPAAALECSAAAASAQREWEAEWSQQGLASRLSPQDYKARKHERLRQKIAEQLRQSVAQSELSTGGRDLSQLIAAFGGQDGRGQGVKGSRFSRIEKLQFAPDEDTVLNQIGANEGGASSGTEAQEKRVAEIKELSAKLSELTSRADGLEANTKKFTQGIQQMTARIKSCESERTEKQATVEIKARTIDILPDAENKLADLQSLVDASQKRLVSLASQWEKHRVPLADQLRELKLMYDGQTSETERKIKEIADIQTKLKELAVEAREKEELCRQLEVEFERMTKDVSRSAYTRRILEIVANIRKQNDDIDKVLVDTRTVQKEISLLSGKLDRTFIVTDELIFKDAKKDEAARKAYKHLAALHENCNILIKTIEETGTIRREIRDLEDLVEGENRSKIEANLAQISADHQQMKGENSALMGRLKQAQGK